ncbi:ATP-binding domain-containing protein [Streptomyces sp. 7-21]|uniref:ATP-binding domain-containing protein n=1 Tax=Streptomyces sp. 7-21 TaxID=2802283 RepID=UPI0027DEA108|nr:helix-hairpin-helix domain-containing protein [Streptomyces sp. 7-21]
MTSEHAASAAPEPGSAGESRRRGIADELRAAVRAVESGERSADSFFPREEPALARQPSRQFSADRSPARGAGADGGPVTVPEGLTALLERGGAPTSLAVPLTVALGEGAEQELREDPWRLLAAPGVTPEQADGFARALLGPGCSPGDVRRTRALTGWLLERAALSGHTVLEPAAVSRGLAQWSVPDPEEAVREAVDAGTVLAFHDPADEDGDAGADGPGEDEEAGERVLLGLHAHALAEESLADGLARLAATVTVPDGEDAAAWEAAAGAAPSPEAAALIRAAAGSGVVVHTGGEAARAEPAALVAAARARGLRAVAAAHTPDGRRRLAALLAGAGGEGGDGEAAAVTVAGLLSGEEGPGRDASGTLAADLLVVLDAPLLDAETAASLVESLPDGTRLVLSGDPLLLGAAGAGRVLHDVLAAGVCPRVDSGAVEPGPLGTLLAGVRAGRLPSVESPGREVVIVPVADAGQAVHRTVQLVADSIPRTFGGEPGGAPVIVPGHGGAAGTRALNAALKARLNPGPGQYGGFDPGDRVVWSPVPGRVRQAKVAAADQAGLWLQDAEGRFAVARERVADTLRHGWALTAHQAAGSRWPAAVVVLPGDAGQALDRSWVYTAFSRATTHLSVVQGAGPALRRAVAGEPVTGRTTRLRGLLREHAAQVAAG